MSEVHEDDDHIDSNFKTAYTDSDRRRLENRGSHKAYRKMPLQGMKQGFQDVPKRKSKEPKTHRNQHRRDAPPTQQRPDLCAKLILDWAFGCHRLTPGEGILESFLLPTVTLIQSPVTIITPTGIQTTTAFHPLDVIICCTGFDASNTPFYPVVGQNGMTLPEKWKHEPESYLSLACPDFPNYFSFTVPNATVGAQHAQHIHVLVRGLDG